MAAMTSFHAGMCGALPINQSINHLVSVGRLKLEN